MNGFINLNKPSGTTSADMVFKIKKLTGCKTVGHMGTLDPDAQGVLPIALGKACRLFDYLLEKKKTYIATFQFGIETDTLDAGGKILNTCGKLVTKSQIEEVLPFLIGKIDQVAPIFSAKKINGRKAYELARKEIDFTPPTKTVDIYSIELLKQADTNEFEFEIECGGGTYIRSIARDMAAKLSTVGIMKSLLRTKSGAFLLQNSHKPEDLQVFDEKFLLPPEFPIQNLERFDVEDWFFDKLSNGVSYKTEAEIEGDLRIYCQEKFFGIGKIIDSQLKLTTRII